MRIFIMILLFFSPFYITTNIAWADTYKHHNIEQEGEDKVKDFRKYLNNKYYLDYKDYKEFSIFLGIGEHLEDNGNTLTLFEITWKPSKYTAIKGLHISSSKVNGMETNAGFIGLDLNW